MDKTVIMKALPQYMWDRIERYLKVGMEAAQGWDNIEEIEEIEEVLNAIDGKFKLLQDDSEYGPDDVYTMVELTDEDGGIIHKGEKCTVMDCETDEDENGELVNKYGIQVDNDGRYATAYENQIIQCTKWQSGVIKFDTEE